MPGPARDHGGRPESHQSGNGQIDVEAPAPAEVLRQEAAQDETECGPGNGDRGIDPERAPTLPGVGERGREQGEHRRGQHGSEHSLQAPGRDQHGSVLRGAPDGRGQGKADDADQERPLGPDHVTDASTQQEQSAEGQRVRGDHPLAVDVGEPQGALRRRQRNDHDGCVKDHHELGAGDDDQRPPVGAGGPTGKWRRARLRRSRHRERTVRATACGRDSGGRSDRSAEGG